VVPSESDDLRRKIMQAGFEKFIKERKYLTNVTPATVEWYTHAFKWLDTDTPSQENLKVAVLKMRARGLKATGCNSAIRALNAYTLGKCRPGSEVQPCLQASEDRSIERAAMCIADVL
jgi:hypothetical protein